MAAFCPVMQTGELTERLPAGDRPPGELVGGRYRLATLLGSGGSADVWRAYDERRDRTVTLKILRRTDEPLARRQFLAEAELLSSLAHPSFVPVIGIQDSCGVTLIAFAHVEGEALDAAAARQPIPLRGLASLTLQLADGLEALHRRGYLHLDLKPANVLLSPGMRIRIIDLGIAEPIGRRPELVRGSRRYVAPEVEAGRIPGPASDVYGLAVIVRALLGSRHESRRVSRVLRRALDPDPSRRQQRPRSFATALGLAVLIDEELASARSRLHRWREVAVLAGRLRRLPRPVALGAALAAVMALAVAQAPITGAGAADRPIESSAPLTAAMFSVPPLASYTARFESQAPYPQPAAPRTQATWVVALRNTGSAGWYRGIAGAQATLALDDGTVVAVQSTPYVGPDQVGWFVARLPIPGVPGQHVVSLHPQIDGRGRMPDLGLHAIVTVVDARGTIAERR